VQLADILDARRVKVPLSSRTKDDVLRELVELAAGEHGPTVVDAILDAVRQREQLLSTGIGSGVAIPHGTTPYVDQLVMAAGIAPAPIDFDALDGKPVELFFLLVGPESASGAHVKALSRISRLLRREALRRELRTASSGDAFLDVVRSSEPA
jgi:mannitol/fructose-specific phosphotransferase system IIA component (Ntr-type)